MALGTAKKHGTPNWTDCATNDLGACEEFYATVFGWTADRVTASDGETYSVQRLEGEMVAGIYELNQQMRSMDVPPHWGTYIEVDHVDATLELVKAEGGTVLDGPFEESEVGRIAIVQDSVGAYLRSRNDRSADSADRINRCCIAWWGASRSGLCDLSYDTQSGKN